MNEQIPEDILCVFIEAFGYPDSMVPKLQEKLEDIKVKSLLKQKPVVNCYAAFLRKDQIGMILVCKTKDHPREHLNQGRDVFTSYVLNWSREQAETLNTIYKIESWREQIPSNGFVPPI